MSFLPDQYTAIPESPLGTLEDFEYLDGNGEILRVNVDDSVDGTEATISNMRLDETEDFEMGFAPSNPAAPLTQDSKLDAPTNAAPATTPELLEPLFVSSVDKGKNLIDAEAEIRGLLAIHIGFEIAEETLIDILEDKKSQLLHANLVLASDHTKGLNWSEIGWKADPEAVRFLKKKSHSLS